MINKYFNLETSLWIRLITLMGIFFLVNTSIVSGIILVGILCLIFTNLSVTEISLISLTSIRSAILSKEDKYDILSVELKNNRIESFIKEKDSDQWHYWDSKMPVVDTIEKDIITMGLYWIKEYKKD